MNVTNRTLSPPKIYSLQIKPRVSSNKRQIEQTHTNSAKPDELRNSAAAKNQTNAYRTQT
jgi:hypothetical protein